MLRFPRVIVVLTAGLLFVAACGGSSTPKPAARSAANDQTSSSNSESTDSSSDDGAGSVSGDIVAGSYQRGSAHVDISGGTSTSADLTAANGVSGGGNTFVNFNDGGSNTLSLILSKTETEAGIAISVNGITTGGQLGDKCKIDVKKNEATEFAGSFSCTGVDGTGSSGVFTANLNIKGTFSAKA